MMCGCTIVSTNCKTGPREILVEINLVIYQKLKIQMIHKNMLRAINKKISKEKLYIY